MTSLPDLAAALFIGNCAAELGTGNGQRRPGCAVALTVFKPCFATHWCVPGRAAQLPRMPTSMRSRDFSWRVNQGLRLIGKAKPQRAAPPEAEAHLSAIAAAPSPDKST